MSARIVRVVSAFSFALAMSALARAAGAADEDAPAPATIEVTVPGDPLLRRSSADPTAATTVIEGEALRVPGQSSAEALSRAPGVQIARAGGPAELATASLRGATTAQTPVYLAGVRLNDDVTGTADLATVPLFWLRRLEVWRGASPVWVDRPGLAGAVLLEPELPDRSRFGSAVGIGSHGERFAWVGGSAGDRRAAAAFAIRGDGHDGDFNYVDDAGTRFDASDDRERRRPNADATAGDVWGLGRIGAGDRGSVTMIMNGYLREQGVTGLGVIPATRARATTRRELVAVTGRSSCGPREDPAACSIEVRAHGLRTAYELDDPLRELGYGTDAQITRGTRFGQDARLTWQLLPELAIDGGAGGSFERTDVSPRDQRGVVARRSSARSHVEAVVGPTPDVQLRAAGILTHDATRAAGGEGASVTSPMARLAGKVSPRPWLDLFASATRTVRVPTLGETFGASAVLRGNPALREESNVGGEGGAQLRVASPDEAVRAALEVVGFARVAEDLVAYRRTSLGGVRPFNVGEARVLGGELALAAEGFEHVRVDLALTLLDPRDVGSEVERDLLPHLSRIVIAPGLELFAERPTEVAPIDRVSLAGRLVYRGERVADPAGLIILPAQAWLDVEATIALAEDRLAVRGRIGNVLDDTATDTLGLPLPGRSVHVAAEVWWN